MSAPPNGSPVRQGAGALVSALLVLAWSPSPASPRSPPLSLNLWGSEGRAHAAPAHPFRHYATVVPASDRRRAAHQAAVTNLVDGDYSTPGKDRRGEAISKHGEDCAHHLLSMRSAAHLQAVSQSLDVLGVDHHHIPTNGIGAVLCTHTRALLASTEAAEGIVWHGEALPEHKAMEDLLQGIVPDDFVVQPRGFNTSGHLKGRVLMSLQTLDWGEGAEGNPHFIALSQRLGVEAEGVRRVRPGYFQFRVRQVDAGRVARELSSHPTTIWVSLRPPHFESQNQKASALLTSDSESKKPYHDILRLTGQGQTVHVGDTGLDFDSCFFHDPKEEVVMWPNVNKKHRKVISYQEFEDDNGHLSHTDPDHAHGTHVTGSVAGDAGPGKLNGMALKAKVMFTDLSERQNLFLPPDFDLYFTPPRDHGAFISSNSWGSSGETTYYVDTDYETDLFQWQHQDFLVVMAAGNHGLRGVLSPGSSKNSLTVGASGNMMSTRKTIPTFSARGPTWDHRIKPEVMAPGKPIHSARSDGRLRSYQCTTEGKSGTSMATPLIAGAVTLIREYFLEGFYPSGKPNRAHSLKPTGALMKAMVVASTRPMTGGVAQGDRRHDLSKTPGRFQGWGLAHLQNVMYSQVDGFKTDSYKLWKHEGSLSHHEEYSGCLKVKKGTEVTVTLVWMDPPPSMSSKRSTLHNLDLSVSDGTRWRIGNEGMPSDVKPPSVPGVPDSGSRWDQTNIVEKVIFRPATDKLRVSVYATHVVRDAPGYKGQPFAVVVTGAGLEEGRCPDVCEKGTNKGCSNGGTCVPGPGGDLQCKCNSGLHHVDCSVCDEVALCSGRGYCNIKNPKKCHCHPNMLNDNCDKCASGWYGPDCASDCKCKEGSCDFETGICQCKHDQSVGFWGGGKCDRCDMDWRGADCKQQSSWCRSNQLIILTEDEGWFQITGEQEYKKLTYCYWIIKAQVGDKITIKFDDKFHVEDPYDPVLVNFPKKKQIKLVGGQGARKEYTTNQGWMNISFYSDIEGVDRGFSAHYTIERRNPIPPRPQPVPVPLPVPQPHPEPVYQGMDGNTPQPRPPPVPQPKPMIQPQPQPTEAPAQPQAAPEVVAEPVASGTPGGGHLSTAPKESTGSGGSWMEENPKLLVVICLGFGLAVGLIGACAYLLCCGSGPGRGRGKRGALSRRGNTQLPQEDDRSDDSDNVFGDLEEPGMERNIAWSDSSSDGGNLDSLPYALPNDSASGAGFDPAMPPPINFDNLNGPTVQQEGQPYSPRV